jgi:hypothetical protein
MRSKSKSQSLSSLERTQKVIIKWPASIEPSISGCSYSMPISKLKTYGPFKCRAYVIYFIQHSGNVYMVGISTRLSCTCPDYQRQQRPCKHLYFIVCQVAQYDELLEKMPNSTTMSLNNLTLLSDMLRTRLGSRLKPK